MAPYVGKGEGGRGAYLTSCLFPADRGHHDVLMNSTISLIAHDQPIILPRDATEKTQYEGELVVVIGKRAKHIKKEEALDYVFGFTIGNDFSERTWQAGDRGLGRAKNSDTFKPMGPWIETDVDLDQMKTIIRVNGNEKDNFKTKLLTERKLIL